MKTKPRRVRSPRAASCTPLAAIQGLYTISQEQAERINQLELENETLRSGSGPRNAAPAGVWMQVLIFVLAGLVVVLIAGFIWLVGRMRRLQAPQGS